jgi:hypothetical protein
MATHRDVTFRTTSVIRYLSHRLSWKGLSQHAPSCCARRFKLSIGVRQRWQRGAWLLSNDVYGSGVGGAPGSACSRLRSARANPGPHPYGAGQRRRRMRHVLRRCLPLARPSPLLANLFSTQAQSIAAGAPQRVTELGSFLCTNGAGWNYTTNDVHNASGIPPSFECQAFVRPHVFA